jgi:hypothetical protein
MNHPRRTSLPSNIAEVLPSLVVDKAYWPELRAVGVSLGQHLGIGKGPRFPKTASHFSG